MQSRSPANALSDVCALAACTIGVSALMNWPGRVLRLDGLVANGPTIRPSTAACILVLSLMLAIVRRINTDRFIGATRAVLSAVFVSVGLFAAWRLLHLVQGGSSEPNRAVSPHTVSSLFFIGVAILLAIRANGARRQGATILALAVAAVPWLALLGYTTGTPLFFGVPDDPGSGMSIITAVALLLLSVGVVGLFPEHGFVALFAANTEGGMLMRVLLPAAVLLPLFAGFAFNHGEKAGWFTRDAALALNLGICSAIIIGLILWIGLLFKRREAEQQLAEAEREQLMNNLRTSLDELRKLQNSLVTVCAWTQRVLDDDGKWVRFEEFLDKKLNIHITHGISEEAATEELDALEDWMANQPGTKKK